jgi:hypothetical protein
MSMYTITFDDGQNASTHEVDPNGLAVWLGKLKFEVEHYGDLGVEGTVTIRPMGANDEAL